MRPREVARYWRHEGLPGIDLLRARYVTHRYARHTHETYTLALIEAGVEEFHYRRSLLRAGSGAVALLDPETVHTGQAGIADGWAYRVLYPAVDLVTSVAAEVGLAGGTPHFPETVVSDPRSARLLRAAHVAAEHGDQLASSSLMRIALAGLLRAHAAPLRGSAASEPTEPAPRPAGRPVPGVRLARDLLHDRLTHPPRLSELAAAADMNPFALLRAFRTETGLPPHAYLNQLRVRRARELLDSGIPPAETAVRTGFADQAHLTRHFKRVLGVPPGAYQKDHRAAGTIP